MGASLKLTDFSDRELLFALQDHADPDGFISSQHLAESLGIAGLGNPTQNVAIRLSWLKRFGVVERDLENKRWGLSTVGASLLEAKLTAAERRAVEDMDPAKLLMVTQGIGAAIVRAGPEAARMATRDLTYHQAVRKRRFEAA